MRRFVASLVAACVCSLTLASISFAQLDTPEALDARAVSAYRAKDFPTFLILEKQILTLNPADLRARYNVASGEALTSHPAEAVSQLQKLIFQHFDFGAENDPDFDGIRKTPEWPRYLDSLSAMRTPLIRSSTAFTLPEKGLMASSVAVDESTGDTYVASVRERKIIKRAKDGVVSNFASEREGLLGVWSLLIDPVRKQMFAALSAVPFMQGFMKEDEGKAGVFVFDLQTGKLLRKAMLELPGEHHILSQMVEDRAGNIFVVDTGSSEIRRLRRSSTELELYISSVVFRAPRGIALSPDQRTLYVMDFLSGLWAVDVLSIDRQQIATPEDLWIGGMTGLLRDDSGFISLQAGGKPNRMVRIRLDAKGEKIASVETLESNHGFYEDPMPGTLSGNDVLYVANSQFDLVDPKTGKFALEKAKETIVLRLPLPK